MKEKSFSSEVRLVFGEFLAAVADRVATLEALPSLFQGSRILCHRISSTSPGTPGCLDPHQDQMWTQK